MGILIPTSFSPQPTAIYHGFYVLQHSLLGASVHRPPRSPGGLFYAVSCVWSTVQNAPPCPPPSILTHTMPVSLPRYSFHILAQRPLSPKSCPECPVWVRFLLPALISLCTIQSTISVHVFINLPINTCLLQQAIPYRVPGLISIFFSIFFLPSYPQLLGQYPANGRY